MDYLSRIVGHPTDSFTGRKLPNLVEVMSVFLYQKKVRKFQHKHSISLTITKVQEKWSEAGIPTCCEVYAQKKLSDLLDEVKKIQKNSKRKKSVAQKKKELNFSQKLKNLFDIAKLNVDKYIDEDKKLFLAGQRSKNRFGLIDNNTSTPSEDQSEDVMVVDSSDADEPSGDMMLATQNSAVLLSDLSAITSSQTSNVVSDFENQLSQQCQQCQTNKIDVMTPELSAALDRAKVTNRNATFILAAAYKSLGIDLSTLNLSYSTIYRTRINHRSNIAQDLKREFRSDDRYVVHWDGKILPDIVDSQSVDRIAVLLSVSGVDQLLGVPKAHSATAHQQASAVITTLNQWNIAPYVKAMCFDTPAVNTGAHKGTCVLIEKALGRKLVWFPCRHHVLEIILRGVFEVFWSTTSGPNVPIFLRFKIGWDNIDQTKYKSGIEDEVVAKALNEDKTKIINFINDCLQISHPRDDYRELLLLSLVFLGCSPTDTYTFKRPGAMHHARWMSKAIYSLKMFVFRDQFHLSSREIKSLRQVCIFIILFYIEAWYTATSAIMAPNRDLELLKKLILNKNINPAVSQKAFRKMKENLWYLNNELATLSLFDDNVSVDIKKKMVHAINTREGSTLMDQRYHVDDVNLKSLLDNNLSDFVSKNSLELFTKFDLPSDFLEEDISTWPNNESFKICLEFFKTVKVTNDVAERGIALIEEYNCCLTKNENQLQYLLQVIRDHRQRFPNCYKKSLQ